jgi:hypothetical protein
VEKIILKNLKSIVLCLLLAGAQADESSWTSQRGLFVVSYQSELVPLQINKLHAWVLHIEDARGNPVVGAQLEVSGGMPVHDHGLPTYPRVTEELGEGDYRLDGMRFHMTGAWEITIIIFADGKTDTVVVTVTL